MPLDLSVTSLRIPVLNKKKLWLWVLVVQVVGALVVEEVVVTVAAVLPVHFVVHSLLVGGVAMAMILPDPLWSHLMQYIPSLFAHSTSLLSIFLICLLFLLYSQNSLIPLLTV